ncbi:MAG: sugar ABC transporter ATP-binding protein [Albidovulum sp.]|nr:sugar ABC transporter ATP-binding protein [Albidovulum sp.]MDE0532187.1 sugar ABC transporter ATP-binding protein [Albidovulum sp.]
MSVLRSVDLDIMPGEIHGLVGENGAGKSTLGKIIGGYYSISDGTLEAFGRPADPWTPKDALDKGIAIMHQELQLVPELTVAENVFLGIEDQKLGVLSGTEKDRLTPIVEATGFEVDPSAKIVDLSIADRQKIEVMRALARNARVIVMDEPTSSLSADETQRLHETMKKLRASGGTVVYVSHFLDNILEVCDAVTILRDGDLVRTAPCAGENKDSLVSAMLGGGRSKIAFPDKSRLKERQSALEVRSLSSTNGTREASFHVNRGEIVGLIGLVGGGRTEILRAVIGADKSTGGEVLVQGKPYGDRSIAESNRRGIVMVPEDRRKQGLIMTLAVRSNMTLPHLSSFATPFGRILAATEKSRSREAIEHFQVKPPDVDGDILNYSGGNQQKVLLAKWLMRDPEIVFLDEPSRGVDVGARQRIHEAIAELAGRGTAVLLVSSELEEVLGLSHRAYLVANGKVFDELVPEGKTEGEVLRALFQLQQRFPEASAH